MDPPEELAFDPPNAWNRPLVDTGAEQPITSGDTARARSTEEARDVEFIDHGPGQILQLKTM